mmetsp:Transcript_76213/g.105849  ORF Transcript_76213/g.105849 Transcript_76213/m.105849 type:complete len:226 (-) Transcript_76213:3-680(-)
MESSICCRSTLSESSTLTIWTIVAVCGLTRRCFSVFHTAEKAAGALIMSTRRPDRGTKCILDFRIIPKAFSVRGLKLRQLIPCRSSTSVASTKGTFLRILSSSTPARVRTQCTMSIFCRRSCGTLSWRDVQSARPIRSRATGSPSKPIPKNPPVGHQGARQRSQSSRFQWVSALATSFSSCHCTAFLKQSSAFSTLPPSRKKRRSVQKSARSAVEPRSDTRRDRA